MENRANFFNLHIINPAPEDLIIEPTTEIELKTTRHRKEEEKPAIIYILITVDRGKLFGK